ncbi:MAG: hypothetical protein QM779_07620 [Propionicimonas sp.]|uniref:hypothetical protein n=1 Tax=Propionicimonas sp. TaxID=1955623 RepID=UPI003D0DF85D
MKKLRWIAAALIALVMGLTAVASAPTAAAVGETYTKVTLGCGYVDIRNISSTKIEIMYGDPSADAEDGTFLLAAKKTKRVHTSRTSFIFLALDATGTTLLEGPQTTYTPQCVTAKTPKISGKTRVGETLTAKPGTWAPAGVTFTYQWYRGSKKIADATSSDYVLTAADKGRRIKVKVTGALDGYQSVTKTSKVTAKVKIGHLAASTPVVEGSATVGAALTVNPGTWSPEGITFTYRWYRSGHLINGAKESSYTPTTADLGKKISAKVTGRLAGFETKSVRSAATSEVLLPV